MPPHLHPRSRLTTSLFGATLLVSFMVVGMPHIIPCPAPRIVLADVDTTEERDGRRRRTAQAEENHLSYEEERERTFVRLAEERKRIEKRGHECPVPKPGGIVGEILGFESGDRNGGKEVVRPEVLVERDAKRPGERRKA